MIRYSQHMYTILIQKMHSSGIIRYNDVINDMTFFSKAKFTKLIMVNQNHSNCGDFQNNNIIILTYFMYARLCLNYQLILVTE